MKSWAILTPYVFFFLPGNHWTIFRPLTGIFFSLACYLIPYSSIATPYSLRLWAFGPKSKRNKEKANSIVNNKPNCAGNTHSYRNTTPQYRSQISYLFRGHFWARGAVNLIPYIWDFPVFDTLNAIRALRAWWRKRYPFYADDVQAPMRHTPPPPPPPRENFSNFQVLNV